MIPICDAASAQQTPGPAMKRTKRTTNSSVDGSAITERKAMIGQSSYGWELQAR